MNVINRENAELVLSMTVYSGIIKVIKLFCNVYESKDYYNWNKRSFEASLEFAVEEILDSLIDSRADLIMFYTLVNEAIKAKYKEKVEVFYNLINTYGNNSCMPFIRIKQDLIEMISANAK